MVLVSWNSVLGQKYPQSVCTSTPTAVPSSRTWIFVRPGFVTTREAPNKNRQFDRVVDMGARTSPI
ncbi:hypothetical protein Taro_005992 [Colocasia esculenta]|uniref:Uncharacterized protein n=1 Tax=Colocasia esculenta TaxID=4460 RepID=A0A843TPW1_COLES|nr:hypothetical protein [Colocasia esculenta]